MSADNDKTDEVFGFFNEIGIIHQLATAAFAKMLPNGVHLSHFSILNHLARMGDGKPPKQIAAAMQVSKNTMTHSLKVLVDHRYIDVHPDPEDGRGKLVYLTDQGRAFREEAIASVGEMSAQIFRSEQTDIMERIKGDLALIRQHLDENR